MKETEELVLNICLLGPKEKHPTIFREFDLLQGGESLTIHNDHDPKPLYYQLLAERGNVFAWEYNEQGPETWKVRITKRMAGEEDETLGEIAAKDLRKTLVFKKYGLDFCCGAKKTVKEACTEKGLDVAKVEQELKESEKITPGWEMPYADWSLTFLMDYIINTHHHYIRNTLPELLTCSEKAERLHSHRHPELLLIHELIKELSSELLAHLIGEENELFFLIKQLETGPMQSETISGSSGGTVRGSINKMKMEHERVGKYLADIRTLSRNYTLPSDACASLTVLYKRLNEFESDLLIHVHLENNILFSTALKMLTDSERRPC